MSKAAVCRNFGSIAHFERRLISERTRDGIARGQEARSNTRAPAVRPGDGFRRAETHRGWIVTRTGRQTARNRQGNGLQNRERDALTPKPGRFGP